LLGGAPAADREQRLEGNPIEPRFIGLFEPTAGRLFESERAMHDTSRTSHKERVIASARTSYSFIKGRSTRLCAIAHNERFANETGPCDSAVLRSPNADR